MRSLSTPNTVCILFLWVLCSGFLIFFLIAKAMSHFLLRQREELSEVHSSPAICLTAPLKPSGSWRASLRCRFLVHWLRGDRPSAVCKYSVVTEEGRWSQGGGPRHNSRWEHTLWLTDPRGTPCLEATHGRSRVSQDAEGERGRRALLSSIQMSHADVTSASGFIFSKKGFS